MDYQNPQVVRHAIRTDPSVFYMLGFFRLSALVYADAVKDVSALVFTTNQLMQSQNRRGMCQVFHINYLFLYSWPNLFFVVFKIIHYILHVLRRCLLVPWRFPSLLFLWVLAEQCVGWFLLMGESRALKHSRVRTYHAQVALVSSMFVFWYQFCKCYDCYFFTPTLS